MLETLLRPLLDPVSLWTLALLVTLFYCYRRATKRLRITIAVFLAITVIGSNAWLAARFAEPLEEFGLKNSKFAQANFYSDIPCQQYSGVIALGGVISNLDYDAKRGVSLLSGAERVTVPVQLARICPNFTLIYSSYGATKDGTIGESELAKKVWIALGLDPSRIRIENKSTNTHENAVEVAAMVGREGKWLLVTSAIHMKRAQLSFAKSGVETQPIPVDYLWSTRPPIYSFAPGLTSVSWQAAAHEYFGLIYYRFKNWI